jgi:hypothetical protein
MGKITYKVVTRKNPVTKEMAQYATQVRYSQIPSSEIVKYAAQISCIDESLIQSVMLAWQQVMRMYFVNGHNVICHPLGSFQANIRSRGAESLEEFTSANIRGLSLSFRTGKSLTNARDLKNNSFTRTYKTFETNKEE